MSRVVKHLLADARRTAKARDTSSWEAKLEQLLQECHPKQKQFVLDPGRRIAALVARGGGKTTAGRIRLMRRMLLTPKAQCLYIAETRTVAMELMWHSLKDLLERLGVEARFNETQLTCLLLKNGSRLRLVGADDKREIDKLRGQPFHEVGVDESASFDVKVLEYLTERVIGPRLGDYGGCLWLIGTPGHVLLGKFYETTKIGSSRSRVYEDRDLPEYKDWKRYSLHTWTLKDGAEYIPVMARLWEEALIEKDSNDWSDQNPVWRREFLGQWAADDTENVYKYRAYLEDGTPWNFWQEGRAIAGAFFPKSFDERRKGNPFGLPEGKEWRYIYGMDMGHSDPFALQIFAWSTYDKNLYQVYEFSRKGMYAKSIAELILGEGLDAKSPTGVMRLTGWPDGIVADLAGLGNMLRDELANVYGISAEAAEKKNKHDAIELFNGDLLDGRIKILKGSKLEEEMGQLQWQIDDFGGKVRENKGQANHCCDAAIYARRKAYHLFSKDPPVARPAKNTKEARELERVEAEEQELDKIQNRGWRDFLQDDEDFTDRFN